MPETFAADGVAHRVVYDGADVVFRIGIIGASDIFSSVDFVIVIVVIIKRFKLDDALWETAGEFAGIGTDD